jgi:hypothetical protein
LFLNAVGGLGSPPPPIAAVLGLPPPAKKPAEPNEILRLELLLTTPVKLT